MLLSRIKLTNLFILSRSTPLRSLINFKKLCSLPGYEFDLKIGNVSLNRFLTFIEEKYFKDMDKTMETEMKELKPVIELIRQRKSIVSDINNLKELLRDNDKEIKALAENEKKTFEQKIKDVDEEILASLLEMHSENNCNSVVLEVNAGVGGQEAMLFAGELFNMYSSYADYKGWTFQVIEYLTTDLGGCRYASAIVEGDSVFNYLVHEAGVHRVQRIPATEKSGRIHTSTASVVVLPQPNDIQIQIKNSDLKIETKRATGAGGQHVNTTDSAVRIVHLPTGISVDCQVDRSQIKNREIALQKLKALLYDQQLQKQIAETERTRKTQVKSNFRNERIRTYNFPQDRITDHRLQGCNYHNISSFLSGEEQLETMIKRLDEAAKSKKLLEFVQDFMNR